MNINCEYHYLEGGSGVRILVFSTSYVHLISLLNDGERVGGIDR